MSRFLTEEQKLIRDTARKFAEREVEPRAMEIDSAERVPTDLLATAAELGIFGLYTPQRYGGSEAGLTATCVALEEISKASPSLGGLLSVQVVFCPLMVDTIGTEAQRERLLRPSATGERTMAISQTEPSGAANTDAHQTRVTRDGNGWRLNGLKIFCTHGGASNFVIFAKVELPEGTQYAPVIIERGAAGFQQLPPEEKLGWRGTGTGTITFDNVWLEDDDFLGDPRTATKKMTEEIFSPGLLGHCATALGCLEGLFDKTLAYVKERDLYGAPMTGLQPVTYWLSDIWARKEACRSMLYTTTALWDRDQREFAMMAACKAFICDTAFECTNRLLQMWGGHGIMNAMGVNRYFRDARTKMIAEGPTELYLSVLAVQALGLGKPLPQH